MMGLRKSSDHEACQFKILRITASLQSAIVAPFFIFDLVEQSRDIAALDIANPLGAKFGIDQPLENLLAPFHSAEAFAVALDVFLADSL